MVFIQNGKLMIIKKEKWKLIYTDMIQSPQIYSNKKKYVVCFCECAWGGYVWRCV